MNNQQAKVYIGFITYGKSTAKYLPYFLPSLIGAIDENCSIIAIDNTEEEINENRDYIKKNYPQIGFRWAGKNLGFAKAYNLIIKEADEQGAEYFFMINDDTILEPDAIHNLVSTLESDKNIAAVSPKILRWDFVNQLKTGFIDTLGIGLRHGLRFVDTYQGQIDQGNNLLPDIIGPSGAAGLYRIRVLEKIKENDNYFDERMFMYKEDCDLAYRMYLAGLKSKIVPEAVIYHDRTTAGKGEGKMAVALNRKNKNRQAKIWSFQNQQLIYRKYWHLQSWLDKTVIAWYEIMTIIFALLFEQYLLKEFNMSSRAATRDPDASGT